MLNMAFKYKLLQLFVTVIVLGFARCNSKQILESLLRQNNNNLVLTVSTNNSTKNTNTSSPISSLSSRDTNQSNSYREFYRLFYGIQQQQQQSDEEEDDFSPNDISRAKKSQNKKTVKDLEDIRQANLHFLKIRNDARCRTPGTKVIRVKDYYPDPTKEYLPRCTIIYRCGDDSGCCDNDAFQCVPRFVQEVALPFYTLHISKQGVKIGNTIEKLLFINHTQCECQPVNDQPRLEEKVTSDAEIKVHHSNCRECPVPFYRREYPDGRCTCDCFDRQRPCLRIKRGRDSLAEIERRCVETGYCHIPDCEYGEYDVVTGLCPKRMDSEGHKKIGLKSLTSNHRWSYLERD